MGDLCNHNFPDLIPNSYGWKHGDLGKPWRILYADGQLKYKQIRDWRETDNTIFFVIYRNPLDWLRSLNRSPHHAPLHAFLPFPDFIRRTWECYYSLPGDDLAHDPVRRFAIVKPEHRFETADSVLALRKSKARIHEGFKDRVPNIVYVNYETVSAAPESWVRRIAANYNLKMHPTFTPVTESKFGGSEYKRKIYGKISDKDMRFIVAGLDWDLENRIGYSRQTKWGLIKHRTQVFNDGAERHYRDGVLVGTY